MFEVDASNGRCMIANDEQNVENDWSSESILWCKVFLSINNKRNLISLSFVFFPNHETLSVNVAFNQTKIN